KSPDDFPEGDFRKSIRRFQGEQFFKNLNLLNEIKQIASEKNITPSQLALAWVLAKGAIPIPGTKRVKYLEQNIASASVQLTTDDMNRLESIVPLGTSTGARYDESQMQNIDK